MHPINPAYIVELELLYTHCNARIVEPCQNPSFKSIASPLLQGNQERRQREREKEREAERERESEREREGEGGREERQKERERE